MFTSFNLRKERQPLPNVVSQLEVTVLSQDLPFTSHRMQVVALIWDYFLTQTVVSLTKSSWFCLFLDASCSLIILWLELHLCCLPMQQSFACLLLAFAFLRSRGNPAPSKNSCYSYDLRRTCSDATLDGNWRRIWYLFENILKHFSKSVCKSLKQLQVLYIND